MRPPKPNTPKEPCYICRKPTVYTLEVDHEPKPICKHCMFDTARAFLEKNVAQRPIERGLYPGWHASLHLGGHLLDIHLMVPTNTLWVQYNSGWPMVFVCSNPLTNEMDCRVHQVHEYNELYEYLRNDLWDQFMLDPTPRQPANEGSENDADQKRDAAESGPDTGQGSEDE